MSKNVIKGLKDISHLINASQGGHILRRMKLCKPLLPSEQEGCYIIGPTKPSFCQEICFYSLKSGNYHRVSWTED